jgi:hypothetical protein
MKIILAVIIATTIATNANAADELHVINSNGDAEIYIPNSENENSTIYVPSGIIADVEDDTVTIIQPKKPSIKVYQPDPAMQMQTTTGATIPLYINQNDYQPLVDKGGDYDSGDDVYRPDLEFK